CEEQPLSSAALNRLRQGFGGQEGPRYTCDASDDCWIVADARIDARDDLIAELGDDCFRVRTAPDVELILEAYLKWGESCVEHLLGDFAFAIWDGRTRRLFCARDHMGV